MRAGRAFGGAAAALAAVASCAGAGPRGVAPRPPLLGAGGPRVESRDEQLVAAGAAVWRGDLGAANAALTRLADRERGVADGALDFWSDLLALLRCEPLAQTPRIERPAAPVDSWDGLRRLVQIERVRLARTSAVAQPGAAPATRTPAAQAAVALGGPDQVVWPVERERWSDELPIPAARNRCPAGAAVASRRSPPEAPEAALVTGTARGLPDAHPAAAVLLVQAAVLDIQTGAPALALGPLARLDRTGALLGPSEKAAATVAAALAALADITMPPDALLARARAALGAGLDQQAARALALLVAERLAAGGREADAVALLGPPPHGDDEVGRYVAFRQAQMHARAGRRAELLAEARALLGRRARADVEDDPASTAVMDLALRTLLASPVSAETLEVLESLGPPRERLDRAEDFAQLALEAGGFQSAMATFVWLRDNDPDDSRKLRHLARASVAAARAGDRTEFARTFRLLAGQEDRGPQAKPRAPAAAAAHRAEPPRAADRGLIASGESDRARERRRERRSADWQQALLVVARDALPALVEGDDQANLSTLVDTLKRHLDDGGRGPVDEQLTTLYRAASAHLKTGPRAYAETVGAARRPILLGDVAVERKYVVTAPAVDLTSAVDEVGPLLFVPRVGNDPRPAGLRRWPGPLGVAWTGSRS